MTQINLEDLTGHMTCEFEEFFPTDLWGHSGHTDKSLLSATP